VPDWVASIGLEVTVYGTHSMRRTKVTQIDKKTGNLRAVQLLMGHTKMDSTVRYLGIEHEDALAIAEAIEISAYGLCYMYGPKRNFASYNTNFC
jgi:integrase